MFPVSETHTSKTLIANSILRERERERERARERGYINQRKIIISHARLYNVSHKYHTFTPSGHVL